MWLEVIVITTLYAITGSLLFTSGEKSGLARGQGEIRWHGVQDDPGTVELRASLPTLPAGERHILVHDADRRRRVGSAVRLRPLAAQTAHPRCPWVTPPVAVSDPNSFEDGALGPLESDAERGMERGEHEPRNSLRFIFFNDLQDIHIGSRGSPASADSPKTSPARTGAGRKDRTRLRDHPAGLDRVHPCRHLSPSLQRLGPGVGQPDIRIPAQPHLPAFALRGVPQGKRTRPSPLAL